VFDPALGAHGSNAAFERGVTAAGSLVSSAVRSGLTTRFVTAGGIDLRGPDVSHTTQRVLARIEPSDDRVGAFDTDMVDGLALLVVVTGSRRASSWVASKAVSDPTITRVLVTTNELPDGIRLAVTARSEDEFVDSWQVLVGQRAHASSTDASTGARP
jgi:hypothetical protein